MTTVKQEVTEQTVTFVVDVKGKPAAKKIFTDHMRIPHALQRAHWDRRLGFEFLGNEIVVRAEQNRKTIDTLFEGTLEEYITPHSFIVFVAGERQQPFYDRNVLNEHLQNLIVSGKEDEKTHLSIIDIAKAGHYINEYNGQMGYYLED